MDRNDILRALKAGEINLADAKKELTKRKAADFPEERPDSTKAALPDESQVKTQTSSLTKMQTSSLTKMQASSQTKLKINSPGNSPDEEIDRILQNSVAIIGMSGQFPRSNNIADYWDNLSQGKNCITEIPLTRWDVEQYYDPDLKAPGKTNCKWMGMLDDIDMFDPLFFSISPAEAELMDPQHRLFLENCWHCVEDAGIRPSQLSGSRCGVFVGCGVSDYGQLSSSQGLNAHGLMGSSPSILSARISYLLNLKGPCMAIDTACSSALVAIAEACNSLILHTSDMCLAGGVNFMFGPEAFIKAGKAGMLSKDGRCFTFDNRANGFVPGEGVGVVLLKRLTDAVRDKDHLYGVVRGWGINQDGKTNGITAPSVNSQVALETEVYRRFNINPETITMVEAHGTGTKLGDPIEVEALTESFGMFTDKKNYCALGSVKSNIGHLIKSAGIAGVIKILLSMKHRVIPPTINFEKLNEHISLENTPFYINDRLRSWEVPPGIPRRACISAFGFSGTNCHLVIEEYMTETAAKTADRPVTVTQSNPAVFVLSAKSEDRLKTYAGSLKKFIESNDDLNLADVAYTLQVGREAMEYRLAMVTDSIEALVQALEGFAAGNSPPGMLTGQVGKGKDGLGALEKDEDAKVLVQAWLEKRKIKKVAELWVKGLELDWNRLYGRTTPNRISIPAYPFARERYWAGSDTGPDAGPDAGKSARTSAWATATESGAATVSGVSGYIHPLLHRNTSDFSLQRFSSDFSGREFFLAHHVVKERRVLPGVAYLEMARAAVEQAAGVPEGFGAGIRLKNVVWARPIVVEDPVRVSIGLYPEENGEISYEIYSEPAGDDHDPIVHSQGRAVLGRTAEIPVINITELKAGCTGGTLSSAKCYDIFRSIGLDYGPGHQGIEKVFIGAGQVLARLSLPAAVFDSGGRFVIHPGLLDSALQASIGLMIGPWDKDRAESRHNPVMPFALQELEVFGRCTREMWAMVRFSEGSTHSSKVQKLDIDLCDESGMVCVRMRGFSSRVLEGEVVSPGIPARFGTMILEPVWEEKALMGEVGAAFKDSATAATVYSRRLVMLSEPFTTLREDIENRLEGACCMSLPGGNEDIAEHFTTCAVRAFEAIRDILRDKPGGKVLVQIVVTSQGKQQLLAALSGILKTAGLENPALVGQLIEIEPGDNLQVTEILEENSRNPADRQIRYQDGRRLVAGWNEANVYEAEISPEETGIPWKDRGIYLITGGAGGLGMIWAGEISQRVRDGVVILAGRSPLSEDKALKLKELGKSGVRVKYRQTDVTQKEAVDSLIKGICEEFGGLDGIIHAAGIIRDNFIIKKDTAEFLEVLGPKVTGLVNLDLAAADLALDFFILFSSGAGAAGNIGQADYATGNAFMDAYAAYRNTLAAANRRHGRTLSVGWPLWKEGGMHVDEETEQITEQSIGMIAMKTTNGIRALYRGLASGGDRIMVLEGDLTLLRIALQEQQNKASLRPAPSEAPGGKTTEPVSYGESLSEKAMNYLKKLLSPVIKLPAERIEADAPMEKYGIDSIMVMQLTNELEKTFGSLSKTLFFEYQNIRDLTKYFLESHRERLSELLGTGEPPAMAAPPSGTATAVWQEPEALQESPVLQGPETRLAGRRRFISFPGEPRENKAGGALDIAVIGVAGRYPQAQNIHEFWENLREGRDCITEIPPDRWDHSLYYDEGRNKLGKTYGRWGGFLDGADLFDPLFFNVSPLEAEFMDPQERLFLECAFETLEDAGYTRQSLARQCRSDMEGNIGVFVGVMWEEYQLFGAQEQALGRPIAIVGHPAEIPNRVSYFCNFHGPSIAVDTMCSSSLTAIHLACQSLQRGECEAALAGGVNLSIHPNKYLLLAQGSMLASRGRCESFGQGGDGYVPAEGVGAVLLKPLSKAVADRDRIYGVIKATAVNHGGKTNGFFVPNPNAQANVIGKAFKEAGIAPRAISYIEAHGTGTSLGDPIEITGLTKAFREYTRDTGFCAIGSAKSNIGHSEGAAGIAGVTKILLQLKHHRLAPSLHSQTLNPNIDFGNTPFIVQQELAEWRRPVININGETREYPRAAGVSCFGAGGANAHVFIEEYIPQEREPIHVSVSAGNPAAIVLSAKNEDRLKEQAGRLLAVIKKQQFSDAQVADIAYTLQVGREAMEERLALTVSSLGELEEKLQGFLTARDDIPGMYRGHIRRNRETLDLFTADEELQEAVEKWLQRKKYGKLLDLWVKGLDFDWNRLYGELKPRRIGLPAYPFAREHYWVPRMYPGAGCPANTTVETSLHPLVHQNTSDLVEQRFSSTFTGEEPFLADNPVYGGRGLPDAACLEMVREAVNRAAEPLKEGKGGIRLKNVVWGAPIIVADEPARIHIGIYPRDDGELAYEIYSESDQAYSVADTETDTNSATGKIHLQGAAVLCQPAELPDTDLLALQDEWLSLPPSVLGMSDRFVLPPVLMNSALQAAAGFAAGMQTIPPSGKTLSLNPVRPFMLQELEILGSCISPMWIQVRYSEGSSQGDKSPSLDIDLCNEQGKICVQMKGLKFQDIQETPEHRGQFALQDEQEKQELQEEQEHREQPNTGTSGVRPDAQSLVAAAVEHLKNLMSEVIRIPVARLDPEVHFEELGLDSIIIARLNQKVEKWIGKLEAAMFFKYNSIQALGAYFAEAYPEAVANLPGRPVAAETPDSEQNHRFRMTGHKPVVPVSIRPERIFAGNRFSGIPAVLTYPDIAVIGVAGRYPGADTLEQFWKNLTEGRDCITEIPPGRWSLDGFYEPDRARAIAEGLSYSKWGGFLNDIDCFDPLFFNISPRNAMFMDPQGRLFLEVAWECVEDAGYTREALKQDGYGNRIGVFVGATFNNYQLIMAEAALKANQDMYFANSQTFSIANRVSHVMDFTGPSLTVDTACSSSLYAIHLACESIRSGISRMAIAGGVNLSLHPSKYITLAQGQFHSIDGRCHAFTEGGTGYVPAEAVGAVFLKPLQDAVRDNDRIYGIIKGTAASHDGKTNGYNVPSPVSQSLAIEEALRRSRIDPRTISYVEAHGTGTALGDPIEITGLTDVFRNYTGETGFCSISSVKSNIGHAEAAAGIAQLTKVILQLKHRTLVTNVMHGQGFNPNIDFSQTPFVVQDATTPWKRPALDDGEIPRRAGISSFGAGGANAHVVIEEYIKEDGKQPQIVNNSSNPAVIVLSARNKERLQEQARRLLAFVEEQQLADTDLADVAYTLQVGREVMEERLGIIAGTAGELRDKLQGFVTGPDDAEGVYRGQAKGNNDFATGLAVDEEMQETIEKWVQRGKYGKVLELWVKGLVFDWQRLYGDVKPKRISLPVYPFARERYWIPGIDKEKTEAEDKGETMVSRAGVQAREDYEIMTFEESWQEEALPEEALPQPNLPHKETLPDRGKTLICFLSNPGSQKTVIEAVKAFDRQAEVVFIAGGRQYQKQSRQQYRVSSGERDTYVRVFEDIRETYGEVDAILYMWALEDHDCIRDHSGIVYLLQSLASAKLKTGRILLAGQYDNEPDRCYLESWIGFERSLGIVMPGTQLAAVYQETSRSDREPDTENRLTDELQMREESIKDWVHAVWKELGAPRVQSALYREGKRHILRVRPTKLSPTEAGNSLLKPGGTYLITGGCGGLGLLFAEHFAKTQPVNLVLTGRSPMDETKQSKIRVLEQYGAGVVYIQADICDPAAMEAGLNRAKERFGRINGVIHAAGIAGSRSILEKEMDSFQRVLAPKVKGTLVLDQLLAEEDLDFTCYFSSSAAILGDFGYCDYAIANRFQMAYAGYRNRLQSHGRRQGKTVVINWPLWLEGGMGLSNLENTKTYLKSSGQRFLETGEGTALFEQLLLQDAIQHLVMVGRPSRIERMLGLGKDLRVVRQPVVSASPGKGRKPEMTGMSLEQCLERDLIDHIGSILRISRDKLDRDGNLVDFGFDSVTLTQLAALLTEHYGIEISPALFYGYSTVEKLTRYFLKEHREAVARFYQEDIPGAGNPEGVIQEAGSPKGSIKEASSQEGSIQEAASPGAGTPEPIAIIGMSGRFPQARNIDEMWAILASGKDAIQEIPPDRFDWRKYYGDPLKEPGKTNCKWCGCIDGVSEFDPQFFEIPPRDAEIIDPRQRLLLQESWNALEDAGYGQSAIRKNRIGMFVGVEEGDYYLLVKDKGSVGANRNSVLAARLAYFLNLDGPVMAINTACSSGLVAAHQACMSLRDYECDTAIAAGVNLILTPEMYVGMSQGGMLSPDGRCFTFEQRANGLVPGEAAAAVVLKRLSQAEADGDPIYAIIRGSGINYDGKTNGITAPNGMAQTALLKSVYDRYQISPEEIEYVVAHGTGTKLGDPVEVNALYDAFKGYTNKQGFCALTSNKTNFGHTFAASGIVSVISLVQALRHETIPASLHCEQENDYINWKESPFYINKTARPWPNTEGRRRTGAVSAFGMSGTNAHMVIQEYPGRSGKMEGSQERGQIPPHMSLYQAPYYLLAFSARTKEALQNKTRDILNVLENNEIPDWEMPRISYTLLEGRHHFNHRCALVIRYREDAVYVLKQAEVREELPNLFHGEVSRNFRGQKAMELFIRELMGQAVTGQGNREKYREYLLALADLYCQGYEIEWGQLFGAVVPGRVHLPTYPFAREHYWVAVTETGKPAPETITTAGAATADKAGTIPNETVAAVMEIIEEVTGFKSQNIGREDRFSEMGFDSIIIMKMAREVLNRFGFPGSVTDSNDLLRLLTEKETSVTDLADYILVQQVCSGTQKNDLQNVICGDLRVTSEMPYTVSGSLAVDETHPFFFDHPLDHISGLQLAEAMSETAKTAWLIKNGFNCHYPVFVSQISLNFNSYCKKETAAYVSAAVAGEDEDENKIWFRTEVKQEDSAVANGHYTIQAYPAGTDIPENDLPQKPVVVVKPCDRKKVNKHNPVNVLVSDVQTGEDAEDLGCYLCFRPENGFFNDYPGEFIDTVILLEACRQTLRVFSAYFREINSVTEQAGATRPETEKTPGVTVPVLKSMKIRVKRPVHKQETVFLKKERFDVATVGKNTLLELKGTITGDGTAIGTYEVDSLVLTGDIFAGMQKGVARK